MEFYYRDNELEALEVLHQQSKEVSRMSVITGRRRVGKTSLALEFSHDKPSVYLFVAKKSEALLCQGFAEQIQQQLDIKIHGRIESFVEIFSLLLDQAKHKQFTLIIDEFQEFININSSVYTEIQCLWDLNKKKSKLHVIFIGSVYSLMHKIFESEGGPLFGRADRILNLRPFSVHQMKMILADHGIHHLQRLFDFYVFTGCVPKYLDILLTNNCFNRTDILNFMLKENSPFLNEGKSQIIEEFGGSYVTYFSILELIARGKTANSEIQSVIQTPISAYLDKLENDYAITRSTKPIDAKPNSKLKKYAISDNFLKFWFRFFHRYRDSLEIMNYDYVKEIIKRDYKTYCGLLLEKFFIELLADTKEYNRIGGFWQRDGKNEIDIVAINDLKKIILLAEVKRDRRRNSMARLEYRATEVLKRYHDYEVIYRTFDLSDARQYLG